MQNVSLTAALERATTWSSYLDSMLSGAITLTNAEADPARTQECMQQAAHAAAQVANAISEYLLTVEHMRNAPPVAPRPGDDVELPEEP
jgi:hypothetical protein